MKKNLNKLEIKKLFRELDYLLSDKEYKDEFKVEFNPEFNHALYEFIKNNPNLMALAGIVDQAKKTQEEALNSTIEPVNPENNQPTDLNDLIIDFENQSIVSIPKTKETFHKVEKDTKVKKLYRLISKKTHPDKVPVKYLNDFYIQAKDAYEKNDISKLMYICNELKIDFDLEQDDVFKIKEKIKLLKEETLLFEKTFIWIWYHSDEKKKDEILQAFILQQPDIAKKIFNSRNG
jgi:hypothetical protein